MWRTPSRAALRDLNSRKNTHSRKRERDDTALGQELTSLTPASLKPAGRSESAGLLVPFSPVPFSASKSKPVPPSRPEASPGKPKKGLIVAFDHLGTPKAAGSAGAEAAEVAAAATTAATAAETAATTAAAETAAAAGVVVVWATEAEAAAAAAAAATSEHRVALVLHLVPRHRLSAHRDRVSAAVVRRHGCEHWLALAGVAFERHQPPGLGLYTRLCGAPPPAAEVVEQIELDVARTNVGEGEAGEGEAGDGEGAAGAAGAAEARRAALRRVLLAWARHDAGTGYVQGMDTIAAAALLPSAAACPSLGEGNEAVEEAAFWWLSYAVRSVRDPTATPAPAPAPAPALTLTLGVGLARCTACSRASMRRAWAGCGRSSAASAARSAWRTPASPRTSRASASTWPSSALAGTSPTAARAPSPQAEA